MFPPSAAGASSGCWPHLQLVFRENMLESRTSNTSQEKPNCPCATRRPHAWLDTQGDGRGQVGDQDQEQDLQRRPHHLHLACRFLHLARYCRSKHPPLPKTLQTITATLPSARPAIVKPRHGNSHHNADEDLHHLQAGSATAVVLLPDFTWASNRNPPTSAMWTDMMKATNFWMPA